MRVWATTPESIRKYPLTSGDMESALRWMFIRTQVWGSVQKRQNSSKMLF
jgi:hypothetical protein